MSSNTMEEYMVAFVESTNALLDHLGITNEAKRAECRQLVASMMGKTLGTITLNKIQHEVEQLQKGGDNNGSK